jgi:hypothetical protein
MSKFFSLKRNKYGGYRRKSLNQKNRKLSRRLYGGRPGQPITYLQREQLLLMGYTAAEIKDFSFNIATNILKLKQLGHDKNQISRMTPEIVHSIFKLASVPEAAMSGEEAQEFFKSKFSNKQHHNPNDARTFFNRPFNS